MRAVLLACAGVACAFVAPAWRAPVLRPSLSVASSVEEMDALIDELAEVEPFDLPAKVRQETVLRRVGRPQFFLRIAERCDAEGEAARDRLAALAGNLQATLSAVVEVAEQKMDDASDVLQEIVVAAAEADGEFLVPLSAERFAALQAAAWRRVDDRSLSGRGGGAAGGGGAAAAASRGAFLGGGAAAVFLGGLSSAFL